jgi:hypothetical protein
MSIMGEDGNLGELWGGALAEGMGYITVIIPIVVAPPIVGGKVRPKILRFHVSLESLAYVNKFEKWVPVSLLNIRKLDRITALLSSLNISISDKFQPYLKALSGMSNEEMETIGKMSGLSLSREEFNKYLLDKVSLPKPGNDVFYLDGVKLVKDLKQEILANVPDIDEINMEQVREMLDILDTLDEVE